MTSRETELYLKTVDRLRQALLDQATDVEQAETTHQGIATTNAQMIGHYERQLGIYRIWKEMGVLIHNEIKATDELIAAYQAAEGHTFEELEINRKRLDDFKNLVTLAGGLVPLYEAKIEALKNDV